MPLRVAQRLAERLAQADAHVLDGVVGIDLDVARGVDLEVEEPVLRDRLQHVVEERHRRGDPALARAVDVEGELDRGLVGLALDLRSSRHGFGARKCNPRGKPGAKTPAYMR